jgi:hypothetical protein
VTAVTVMSTTLRAAVESTIGKRPAARPPLNLDCFCAAMMNLLEDQAAMQPDLDLDASSRVDPDREGAASQAFRIEPLSREVNEN